MEVIELCNIFPVFFPVSREKNRKKNEVGPKNPFSELLHKAAMPRTNIGSPGMNNAVVMIHRAIRAR